MAGIPPYREEHQPPTADATDRASWPPPRRRSQSSTRSRSRSASRLRTAAGSSPWALVTWARSDKQVLGADLADASYEPSGQ